MKTIDFSYFIERYNAGEMDQNEKDWFAKELEGNLSLQKEVLLRKKTDLILERQDVISLRTKLASLEKSRSVVKIKKGKLLAPGIRYAAVFTGLIVLGSLMFLSLRTESPVKLYKEYYQTYDNPGTSRPAGETYNDAVNNFNKRDFSKTADGYNPYLKNNTISPQIAFLKGISYMEIKRFQEAESLFRNVIDNKINPYTVDANWYLALCYLATEDMIKAKEQLNNIIKSESIYKIKAKKILRHL
jgi:tetratricopeptide (TPR) repeat protein